MVGAPLKQALCGVLLSTACSLSAAHAAELSWQPSEVARCVAKTGAPSVRQAAGNVPLSLKSALQQGDTVATGKDGAARLLMRDGSVLDLAQDTTLLLQAYKQDGSSKPSVRLKTLLGRLWAHVLPRSEQDFVVEGANAIAGVRGTSFLMEVTNAKTTITTETGSVNVAGPGGGSAQVGPLQQVQVGLKGPLTVVSISVNEMQTLQKTMHIGSGMESGSGERLVQNTQQQRNANPPPAPPPQAAPLASTNVLDRGVPATTLNTAPTLSIDPGARLTHVKARIELRP